MCYHEVLILVTVASGYLCYSFSLEWSLRRIVLIKLWARIQASVPRPHSFSWSRLARSIYELRLAGADPASRFLLTSQYRRLLHGRRWTEIEEDRERERTRERHGESMARERRHHTAADDRNVRTKVRGVICLKSKKPTTQPWSRFECTSGLMICANIRALLSEYISRYSAKG